MSTGREPALGTGMGEVVQSQTSFRLREVVVVVEDLYALAMLGKLVHGKSTIFFIMAPLPAGS